MNKQDNKRNLYMLHKSLARNGYDWWWHSFTARNAKTGKEQAFYIEFFIINPELSKDEAVLGQLPYNKEHGIRPSYIMVNVGAWGSGAKQLHNFYPVAKAYIAEKKLDIRVNGCRLTEDYTCGTVHVLPEEAKEHPEYMSDAGRISWELKIDKKIAFNVGYGASSLFRRLNAFEMFWHAQGMKTLYSGRINMDGEEYIVQPENCYGYADKNWGRNFTSPWIWISSCNLYSTAMKRKLNSSVIDVGGGRPKVYGIPFDKKLLIDFFYEGKDIEFNFSKLLSGVKTSYDCSEENEYIKWQINTQNRQFALKIRCRCMKSEMLKINYEAPDGSKKHNRLWNGGTGEGVMYLYEKREGRLNLLDKIFMRNVGCEYGMFDE